jgi:hypothetical protein
MNRVNKSVQDLDGKINNLYKKFSKEIDILGGKMKTWK